MIQSLKIKNFYSIRGEVELSFLASNDSFAEESQIVKINDDVRLMRFAMIYGYNASGKSNILKAFNFLRDFWFRVAKSEKEGTGAVPFKLDRVSSDEPSSFDLVFFVKKIKYRYILELNETQVVKERLLVYKTAKPIELFSRTLKNGLSKIDFKSQSAKVSKLAKEKISLNCLKNISFFAAKNQVNVSIPLIDDAKNWLQFHFAQEITPRTDILGQTKKGMASDSNLAEYVLKFLKDADFNVSRLDTDTERIPLSEESIGRIVDNDKIPAGVKEQIVRDGSFSRTELSFEHTVLLDDGLFSAPMQEKDESMGTLRTLELETALYYALRDDYFMTIDEIETSLHPKLLESILFDYLKNKSESQIVISTHNDGLLDLTDDLFRKDSIWFVEKQKDGSSELYRLSDFNGVNRLTSIRSAYRNKRFGATQFSV